MLVLVEVKRAKQGRLAYQVLAELIFTDVLQTPTQRAVARQDALKVLKAISVDAQKAKRGKCPDRGIVAIASFQQGMFAEVGAGTYLRQHHFAAILALREYLRGALVDDIECAIDFALIKDDFARPIGQRFDLIAERDELVLRQGPK